MINYLKKSENRIFVIVFLVTMFVATSPLMTKLCINGHDLEYHLLRIEALKEGILMGKPFLKVNVLFFGGAGYASSMFYPDFLLYFPALLRVIGVSINTCYHIFVATCIILTYFTTYYSVSSIAKNRYAGIISAVILTLCNYHIDDVFVRGAVGEYTAFIFAPLVIYGIYNTVYEEMNKPYVLGIGFIGLLLCHTLSFAILFVVTALVFIINIKTILKNRVTILRLLATAIISAGITCSYWLPMLEQMLSTKFYVTTEAWINPAQEAMQVADCFNTVFPALGFAVILFVLPLVFLKKAENDTAISFSKFLIIIGIVFTYMVTDLFPWERLGKFMSAVQFPWRFFLVVSVLFSMAAGVILTRVCESVKLNKFIIFTNNNSENVTSSVMGCLVLYIVIAVMTITAFDGMKKNSQGYYDYSNDYYSYKPFTSSVIAGEWLPSTVEDPELIVDMSDLAVSNNGDNIDIVRYKNSMFVTVDKACEYIDVPFIFYKGYAAELSDRTSLSVDGSGNNGFARVYTNGNTGKITVSYKGTFAQHLSKGISFASIVLLIFAFMLERRRKNS